jgi:hypothetical protein
VLPADLFGIYGHFLTQAKGSLQPVFIQAIFRWLVFSTRQLTSDELADAMAFRLSGPNFDFADPAKSIYYPNRRRGNSDSFKLLEGLIVIKSDGSAKQSITLAHSSVKDYILSPQFQQEFSTIIDLTKDVSHKFIAQTCVRYLLLFADTTHSITKDTLPDYPISLYVAGYWFHHLQCCDNDDQEALLPSTMCLLQDGSSQYAALNYLSYFRSHRTQLRRKPISPLGMCSEMGYTKGVQSLLSEHSAPVDQATKGGKTALHLASLKGSLDIVQLLIEHNASVNQAAKRGWTALHLASENGHFDIVQLLVEHNACVDQVANLGWTALHLASEKGHLEVVQLLVKHSASVDQATRDGRTALHLASEKGHLDIMQLLVKHSTSVDRATKDGKTALHLASENGHLDIVQLLVEHR